MQKNCALDLIKKRNGWANPKTLKFEILPETKIMEGDGHCFFRAFSDTITGSEKQHDAIGKSFAKA